MRDRSLISSLKAPLVTLLFLFCASCGKNDQFTTKLTASPFLAELYGESTKTIALSAEAGEHISWMGLEWSGDYKWFSVEQVSVSGTVMTPETDGPTAVFEDISVVPSPNLSGSAESPTATPLMVKITYAPLQGLKEVDLPHRAYLLIAYDKPNTGVVRVELMGFVRGVCDESTGEECNFTSAGDLDPVSYHLVDNKLDIFTCHPQTATAGIANDPEHPNTRHDQVEVTEPFILYVAGDKSAVHLVRSDATGQQVSVPPITISIPDPGLPINELKATFQDGQNVKCPVDDETGSFLCEEAAGVDILGVIQIELEVSSGTVEPKSDQCDFGSVSGSGTLEDDEITVVAWGVISTNLAPQYMDAVVVVRLPLKKDAP